MKKLILLSLLFLTILSCEKIENENENEGGGNNNQEPETLQQIECEPGTIDFVNQVLPILQSSCATTACHNSSSAKEGIVLNSYANIIKIVNKGNASGSKLYSVLNDTGDDLMPPTNSGFVLSLTQKNIIKDWINQGAKNVECTNFSDCDTTQYLFSANVKPLIETSCVSCHSGSSANGSLATYTDIKVFVNNGKLLKSIKHMTGAVAMPQGQAKWSDCKIDVVSKWIDAGALNN